MDLKVASEDESSVGGNEEEEEEEEEGQEDLPVLASEESTAAAKLESSLSLKISKKLNKAIRKGNEAECRRLIESKGADIHRQLAGKSLIMIASESGQLGIIKMLESKGGNLDDVSKGGCTALILAIENKHTHEAKCLISKVVSFDTIYYNRSSLMWAAFLGQLDIVQLLWSKGASIKVKKESAMVWAFNGGGCVDVVKFLVSKGGSVHDKTSDGWSCVHAASCARNIELLEYLVSQGADIHEKLRYNNDHLTPIQCAVHPNYWRWWHRCRVKHSANYVAETVAVVQFLLCNGADPYITDDQGRNCFQIAGDVRIKFIFEKWSITMAILVFQALSVYYHFDCQQIIDLYQYLG
jgi:ankyrin repeat protein